MTLTDDQASFVSEARTATLGTIAENGRPRLVPICFVLEGEVLYTPIDEKPKQATDPRSLARIRDIERRADVTLLIDRWDEDWDHLAWLRIEGRARLRMTTPNGTRPSRRSARSIRSTPAMTSSRDR